VNDASGREPTPVSGASQVVRNVAAMSLAEGVTRVLAFAYNVALMRYLGALGYGQYAFAFALVALVGSAGEWGFGMLTAREVAREPRRAGFLIGNLVIVDAALGGAVLAATVAIAAASGRPPAVLAATAVVALFWTTASVTELLNGVVRGRERLDLEGALSLVEKCLAVGLGFYGIWRRWELPALVGITLAAGLGRTALTFAVVRARFAEGGTELKPQQWPALIREAIPLGLAGILMLSYYRVDMVLLPLLCGERALGVYAAARKLVDALSFVPSAFLNATLPRLSRHAVADPESFRRGALQACKAIALATFPVAGFLSAFAEPLATKLLGQDFAVSADVLRVVAWSYALMGTNYVLWSTLTAADRQVHALRCTAAALAANVLLNLCLIPRLHHLGAAVSLVATEGIACALMCRAARDLVPVHTLPALWLRPGLSVAVLVLTALIIMPHSLIAAALASASAFAGAAFITRAVTPDDWRTAVSGLFRRVSDEATTVTHP